jgi:mismatch-specific thymine-DNA glycosylase
VAKGRNLTGDGSGNADHEEQPVTDLTLPDILRPGLDLIFVGINPSVYSAQHGHYFARPSNRFWTLLSASGLVPCPLGPADDVRHKR